MYYIGLYIFISFRRLNKLQVYSAKSRDLNLQTLEVAYSYNHLSHMYPLDYILLFISNIIGLEVFCLIDGSVYIVY